MTTKKPKAPKGSSTAKTAKATKAKAPMAAKGPKTTKAPKTTKVSKTAKGAKATKVSRSQKDKVPKNMAEAVSLGYKILSGPPPRQLPGTFAAAAAQPKDCTQLNPGDICYESGCVKGVNIIMFCDGDFGCTKYTKIRC